MHSSAEKTKFCRVQGSFVDVTVMRMTAGLTSVMHEPSENF